jgi:polysaccharide export outer membrane protein
MATDQCARRIYKVRLVCAICVLCGGCLGHSTVRHLAEVPRELAKVPLPDYVIEPPDILLIDAVRVVPRPPYRIEPLDALAIQVTETLPQQPIAGIYTVEPDGTVNLGFTYGAVSVVDLTVVQAKAALEKHLMQLLVPGYQVTVGLAESRGRQQIRGEHLVRQDGKVNLGTYGSVAVAGLTLAEAKAAVELHLSRFLLKPEVSIDVAGFNSKVYYVITDNAGAGEQVTRVPITGYETVLDAVSQINGLPPVASKSKIWVARPSPDDAVSHQILPVNWVAITQSAKTATNYQLLPGDRIYVKAQPLVTFDNYLAKVISPVERVFGITLLGNATVRSLKASNTGSTSSGSGLGF